jgi:hypothetical protein
MPSPVVQVNVVFLDTEAFNSAPTVANWPLYGIVGGIDGGLCVGFCEPLQLFDVFYVYNQETEPLPRLHQMGKCIAIELQEY